MATPCVISDGGKYALVASDGSIMAAGGGSSSGPSWQKAGVLALTSQIAGRMSIMGLRMGGL
jgi:hypothetical protein